jgi:CHAD domain-containing protein
VSGSPHRYTSLLKRIHACARELPRLEDGSVEARHRARVASRRLRELLPLFALDREITRKLNRRLRRVTKQLGTVRELDVLTLLIEELLQRGRHSPAALRQVGAVVAHARVVARERLAAKLTPAKLERLSRKLERAAKHLQSIDATSGRPGASDPRRAWRWVLDARIARRSAQVRSAIVAAGAVYAPEPLHDVRIALKKLRYAVELSRDGRRQRTAADIRALKRAQDLLGRLHDLEVLLERSREVQASLSPPDLIAWRELGSLVHAVEDDCRQLHARYMRDRAKLIAIADQLGAFKLHAASVRQRAAG